MLAYAAIESTRDKKTHATTQEMDSTNKQPIDTVKLKSEFEVTYSLIEKCVDLFRKQRNHRNIIDFDKKYLKSSPQRGSLEYFNLIYNVPSTDVYIIHKCIIYIFHNIFQRAPILIPHSSKIKIRFSCFFLPLFVS